MEKQIYRIAEYTLQLLIDDSAMWRQIQGNFAPFAVSDGAEPDLVVTVDKQQIVDTADFSLMYEDPDPQPGEVRISHYKSATEGDLFYMQQPFAHAPKASIWINSAQTRAHIAINDATMVSKEWIDGMTLSAALQMVYLVVTAKHHTLMAHASCIVNDGRAYLFIARSGTGKSTHSSLWLKHIPGSMLLNDDHPIVRVNAHGEVIAYGSPWSGKTPCYINGQAPVGAIVRIQQAPFNRITRQSPVLSYASLSTSFSGMRYDPAHADVRHETLEHIVALVPCYLLECLPDEAAALLSHKTITKKT